MVNRLKGAMGEIVHPDQTCGVPGRRVADSLALIRDTIQYITDRNIRAALVCLDQEKAFDRVSHEFMGRVLQGFGLGKRFCNYVRIMYTDIFSSVMVNGWKTDPFPIRTGKDPRYLVWGTRSSGEKLERTNVKRTVMHKEHRKVGKAVPDIPTILRAFFVCGCIRITLTNENKDHSAYRVFRFFLLPVWRRLG
ncbi:hypothetical protein NDU88_001398 [Pleurodeles waltl]|uniref:Reverse transcriptase domain-containing protein n=1 Tax=Pleurodeles waltl TaxID=8319 RepID=A0AAV7P3U2_PLEWA|nr:hypothetical protein NDU88_001398 [Pleurodeles waltl]